MQKEKTMDMQTLPQHWQEIYEQLPPLASRKQVAQLSGGLVGPSTLANKYCQGLGINGRIIIGKRTVYPKIEVIRYLMSLEKPQKAGQ